jgi:tryptophanyl-tRNA synthetase
LYGDVLVEPEPLLGNYSRLIGTDGNAKMSKSLGNAIYLSDSSEEVARKVMRMYTDPNRLHATDRGKVEGNPVFIYLDAFGVKEDKDTVSKFKTRYLNGQVGDVEVKRYLVKVLNRFLEPIRKKREEYKASPKLVQKILQEGTEKTYNVTKITLQSVKKAMKLDYLPVK